MSEFIDERRICLYVVIFEQFFRTLFQSEVVRILFASLRMRVVNENLPEVDRIVVRSNVELYECLRIWFLVLESENTFFLLAKSPDNT